MPALLVSTLFRWPCSTSIEVIYLLLSPRFGACTAGALAMQHFYSFVSHVIFLLPDFCVSQFRCLHCLCPPFPLATQHFYSVVSHVFCFLLSPRLGVCTAGVLAMQDFNFYSGDFFTFASLVRCLHRWHPPFSAGHAALLFMCFARSFLYVFPYTGYC